MTAEYRTVTERVNLMTKALLSARDALPDGIVKHYMRNASREMMTVHKELQYAQGQLNAHYPEIAEKLTCELLAAMAYEHIEPTVTVDPRVAEYLSKLPQPER